MKDNKKKPKDVKGTIRRLLAYIKDYRLTVAAVLLFCLVSNILALLGPSLAGKAINEADAGAGLVRMDRVYHYAFAMLAVYVSSSLINFTINRRMARVSRYIGKKLREDIFNKLMKLPVGFFDQHQAGDIISTMSYDVDVVVTCLATDIVQIMTSSVTIVGALVMMFLISPWLMLITLITVPLAVFYTKHRSRMTKPLFSRRSACYGRMNGFAEEMFSGQKTIRAYAYECQVSEKFAEINEDAANAFYNAAYHARVVGPTVGLINNLGLALIAIFGSFLYLKQMITLGGISSFVLYSRRFAGPINAIAEVSNEIFSALAALERIFRLLDEEEEKADAPEAEELSEVRGEVTIRDVSFGYVPEKTIIHHLNLQAEAGKMIAIVGPTGAGKTTIINLLMRFYDIDEGQILVDGKDIYHVSRDSLRRAYAMVLQDTWVFHGTIFENIAYGKEGATLEEVIAAAKAARIHSYIMRLPKGYDTVLSEDGNNISKGQKQLLTIARAMLYNARILILDEATSNVDTTTERQIQSAMRKLMADKTCFVIAHRLSTIQNADRILVIRHGDVEEQGTHEELMEKRGFYYQLYAAQYE